LNRLFNLAGRKASRSLQFEFKLLTKFLHLHARRFRLSPPLRSGFGNAFAFRIQPDCQTSAHPIRDFAKANYMPASKAVRLLSKRPRAKIQPVTGRFYYNQKIGKSERTSSERGLSGLQSEFTSSTASCCQPYPKRRFSRRSTGQTSTYWRLLPSTTLAN
jgi:hypothetical protein